MPVSTPPGDQEDVLVKTPQVIGSPGHYAKRGGGKKEIEKMKKMACRLNGGKSDRYISIFNSDMQIAFKTDTF